MPTKSKIIKVPLSKSYVVWRGTVARKGVRLVAQTSCTGKDDTIGVEVWSAAANRYQLSTDPDLWARTMKQAFFQLYRFMSWHNSLMHEALYGEFPKIE